MSAADAASDAAGFPDGGLPSDSWIGDLFPEGVLARVSPLWASEAELWPEERRLLGGAVPARRREFATGRVLARELLARIGHAGFPLLRGEDRLPRWPDGVVGSISHTADLCVVAVAVAGRGVRSLGVDVEPDAPLEPALWPEICGSEEIGWLRGRPAEERGGLARLMFSAKESLYKCVHPVTRGSLGFQDVRIDLSPETRTFSAILGEAARERHGGLERLPGAFARRGGWIFTGVTWR